MPEYRFIDGIDHTEEFGFRYSDRSVNVTAVPNKFGREGIDKVIKVDSIVQNLDKFIIKRVGLIYFFSDITLFVNRLIGRELFKDQFTDFLLIKLSGLTIG